MILMEKTTTLKPCPFCGNSELYIMTKEFFENLIEENGNAMQDIKCTGCGMTFPEYNMEDSTDYEKVRNRLIDRWNTRAEQEEEHEQPEETSE